MSKVTVNLNDVVEFVLSVSGAKTLNQYNTESNQRLIMLSKGTYNPSFKTDYKEGDIWRGQLWEMVGIFKSHCSLGMDGFSKGCNISFEVK